MIWMGRNDCQLSIDTWLICIIRARDSGLRCWERGGGGKTDEVAAVEADDDGMSTRLNVFGDEDVSCDRVGIDGLVGDIVDIESREFLLDGCDLSGIHAGVWR